MNKFRSKYAALVDEYEELSSVENLGKQSQLKPESGFSINLKAPQVIGHSKIMLNYLFYNMSVKDKFSIISHTGEICGQLHMQIRPIYKDRRTKNNARNRDTIRDIKNMKSIDLEISITKCTGLPIRLASDIRYKDLMLSYLILSYSIPCNAELY